MNRGGSASTCGAMGAGPACAYFAPSAFEDMAAREDIKQRRGY